jgi:hypothetical protein
MDESGDRFAYRCLPMLLANTAGWVITNPAKFYVSWNGGEKTHDLSIEFPKNADDRIVSHFGNGVLTFTLPYLFQTPKNINLWVKGPSNWPKDGIQALEGIVETDWATATFTMNWKLTRPNHIVSFAVGEPICMVIPISRGLAEGLNPVQTLIKDNPELQARHLCWAKQREQFLKLAAQGNPTVIKEQWQKDYFKGHAPSGEVFPEHQTQINLKPFSKQQTEAQLQSAPPDSRDQAR